MTGVAGVAALVTPVGTAIQWQWQEWQQWRNLQNRQQWQHWQHRVANAAGTHVAGHRQHRVAGDRQEWQLGRSGSESLEGTPCRLSRLDSAQ